MCDSAILSFPPRLQVRLSTDLVQETLVVPCSPETTVDQLLSTIHSLYDSWHNFPVFEFQLRASGEPFPTSCLLSECDGILKGSLIAEESEASREERIQIEERAKLEAEKQRLQRELEEEQKKIRINELMLEGECWMLENNCPGIDVPLEEDGRLVRNLSSLDQWCPILQAKAIAARGKAWFSVRIESDPVTSNSWRMAVGVAPVNYKVSADKRWAGAQKSWAYIAGNGGKVYNTGRHSSYGAKYKAGDVIGVLLDFDAKTIEFYKNGKSQGIAFKNLVGPVLPIVSMTAKGAEVRIVDNEVPEELRQVILEYQSVVSAKAEQWRIITSDSIREAALSRFEEFKSMDNAWDPLFSQRKDRALFYPHNDLHVVVNEGSGEKWRSTRSIGEYSSGLCFFEVLIDNDAKTTNTWRVCIGIVPTSFDCKSSRMWVGSKGWGYIAGTGGKVYNSGQSVAYGDRYRQDDVIGVLMDFSGKTVEFFRNGESQGIAFRNLVGPVYAAASVTGTGTRVELLSCTGAKIQAYRSRALEQYSRLEKVLEDSGNVWDSRKCSKDLRILEDGLLVENTGSEDKWRSVGSLLSYSTGRRYFEVVVNHLPSGSNSWKICVGVVDRDFDFSHQKLWVGAQGSWGYLGGTGGKCHGGSKSVSYGSKYGLGDRIGVLMDFDNRSIEFFKNGVNQGIAFEDLTGPVLAAVSLVTEDSSAALCASIENDPQLIEELFLYK